MLLIVADSTIFEFLEEFARKVMLAMTRKHWISYIARLHLVNPCNLFVNLPIGLNYGNVCHFEVFKAQRYMICDWKRTEGMTHLPCQKGFGISKILHLYKIRPKLCAC